MIALTHRQNLVCQFFINLSWIMRLREQILLDWTNWLLLANFILYYSDILYVFN